MADVPIVNRAMVTAPKDYQLPQGQEILLKAVRAEIDGSGAAAAFLPALQLISDAGDVMWTAVSTGSSIAAGGSASVTWFPGLGSTTSSNIIGGQIVQTYWGSPPASDFTWTGPAATTVSTTFPTNSTFTKLFDNTYLQLIFEGDFIPGAAADNISLGLWLNGANRLNVAAGTVGSGAFSSVQGASVRNIAGDPVAFPAGAYSVNMRVSSFTGQTTTFSCHAAATLSIVEIGPV